MNCAGRGGQIRTDDPLLPKQMRYQAALRPDSLNLTPLIQAASQAKVLAASADLFACDPSLAEAAAVGAEAAAQLAGIRYVRHLPWHNDKAARLHRPFHQN